MRSGWIRGVLGAVIVLLLGLLVLVGGLLIDLQEDPLLSPRPREAQFEWERSLYGYGPAEGEQLLMPTSVAVSPTGDIYVTDPIRSRILVFDADGDPLRIVFGQTSTADILFTRPEAIDVDPGNGDLYVADSQLSRISVFDAEGNFVRAWPVAGRARGVKVTSERVLVLGLGEVIAYDKKGAELSSFGTRGSAPGQIDAYLGIESDGERIFIADSFNKRIQAFSLDGALLWAYPSSETTAGAASADSTGHPDLETDAVDEGFDWQLPQDLVLDGAGRLVVVDAFRFEFVVVDAESGVVLGTYGEYGRLDGDLYFPTSVAYDYERDWFVVADTQNNRAQIVRIPGSAGAVLAPVRRLVDDPSRYYVLPLAMFVLVVLIAGARLIQVIRRRRTPSV